jgi:hypothetical protein
MSNTKLLYLTFGKSKSIHCQAAFSILSFLARGWHCDHIVVMTDSPSAYSFFENRINILEVNEALLRNWRGQTNNFFRAKIKALEHCIGQSSGENWLYLDSDTFLFQEFQQLQTALENGRPLLHLCEGRLSELKSKSVRQLWSCTKNRSFGGIHFDEQTAMWNAGVIGIPGKAAPAILTKVLQVCDELCREKIRPRLIEQLSFSVVLAHFGGLRPSEDCVAHYWSNKPEWEAAIAAFFADCFLEGLDFKGVLGKMAGFDFQKIPVERKERRTKQRLVGWVGRVFADKVKGV